MVRILALLALVAGTARADLGIRDGVQGMPLPHARRYAGTFGIVLARDLALGLRGALELDTVVLLQHGGDDVARDAHGFGARAQLALRRRVAGHDWGDFAVFADLELGGGAALVRDTVAGDRCVPGGFVGVRLGYDIPETSRFEAELLFRAIVLPEDNALMFGVGFAWD